MKIVQLDEAGSAEEEVGLKAKRALVGAGARILFYPTLAYNIFRNKIQSEFRWWDRVDPYVLLGAVPFPSDVPHLQQLGVRGVVTLNEPYETLVPSSLYQAHGIDHLVIPTRDYLYAPSLEDICQAVDFIHRNASCGKTTYVHCKAGRGRSTTIVLCYLIEHKDLTPEAALNHVRSIRPRVLLAPAQWQAVQDYSRHKLQNPSIQSQTLIKGNEVQEAATSDLVLCNTNNIEFSNEDLILSFFQIALPSPRNPCGSTGGGDEEVLVTEADLEGYENYTDPCVNNTCGSKGTCKNMKVMRRLTCLFGALNLASSSCETAASPVAEIHACAC